MSRGPGSRSSAATDNAPGSKTTSATTKTPGCAFHDYKLNEVWLELVLIAHNLIIWTQTLLLTGDLAKAEPKRLRYRLLHVAARLALHARQARLRLQATWPWAAALAAAFAKLEAIADPPA